MEKGFIMADIMAYADYKEAGSEAACKVSHYHALWLLHSVLYVMYIIQCAAVGCTSDS